MVVGILEDLPSAGLGSDQVAKRFLPMPVYDAGAGKRDRRLPGA